MINRRPDAIDETSMTWNLFPHVGLRVVLYSDQDDDNRPADHSEWWFILKGWCWVNDFWHAAPGFVRVKAGRRCNVQLSEASDYEDKLFDMRWMEQPDIHYSTDKRLWLLVLS